MGDGNTLRLKPASYTELGKTSKKMMAYKKKDNLNEKTLNKGRQPWERISPQKKGNSTRIISKAICTI